MQVQSYVYTCIMQVVFLKKVVFYVKSQIGMPRELFS